MFSKQCKDCEKPCTKSFDVDTHNRMSRCYKCQTTFELDLKYESKNRIGKNGNKWQFWVKLQELKRWDSIDREVEQLVLDNHEQNKKNPFDKSIVNAMANANVSMEIKKNKVYRRNIMDYTWIMANWEWVMLGFYTIEKIVKLSPTKQDDIIFDTVLKPIWDKLPFGK